MYKLNFLTLLALLLLGCVKAEQGFHHEVLAEYYLRDILEQISDSLKSQSEDKDKIWALAELAHELAPKDPRVLDAIGCIYLFQGNLLESKRYFKEALMVDSEFDLAYEHLAAVAVKNGDRLAARELLQLAISKNPLNYRARNNFFALDLNSASRRSKTLKHRGELLKAIQLKGNLDEVLKYNLELAK